MVHLKKATHDPSMKFQLLVPHGHMIIFIYFLKCIKAETSPWVCIIIYRLKLLFFLIGLNHLLIKDNYKSTWIKTISLKLQNLGLSKEEFLMMDCEYVLVI